jgi:hypothetical protein
MPAAGVQPLHPRVQPGATARGARRRDTRLPLGAVEPPLPGEDRTTQHPDHFEVRRVSTCGTFRIHSSQIFLSDPLANESIGLEEIDDGLWNIVYYDTLLGRVDEESRQITGAPALK